MQNQAKIKNSLFNSNNFDLTIFSNDVLSPKAILIIVHGMAEHIDRYQGFFDYLREHQILAIGYNQRGHYLGVEKEEDYGFLREKDGFGLLLDDLNNFYLDVKAKYPKLPIFIFGHSMGSFITQRFIQSYDYKLNGVILSGTGKNPNLILSFGHFLTKLIIFFKGPRYRSKFIHNLSFGSYTKKYKDKRTDLDWLSRDHEIVDKYIKDKWCGGVFSTAFFRDFYHLMSRVNKDNRLLQPLFPVIMLLGDMDPVGNYGKGVTKLYNIYKKQNIDVKIKLYKDARHEILNDFCKDEVRSDILNFIEERIK